MTFEKLRHIGSVCVLGLGITGQALCRLFAAWPPERLTVYAPEASTKGLPADIKLPPQTRIIEREEDLERLGDGHIPFDLCLASPGIPQTGTLYQRARALSLELISEAELAWRLSPERWIVITGTNGKTTTTAYTAHLLNTAGIVARSAGNIGTPCIDAIQQRAAGEYLIAELSSFQLASSPSLAPQAAVLLNITPDHLAWHGGLAAYQTAKSSFVQRMAPDALVVVDATLPLTRELYRGWLSAGRRVVALGTSSGLFESMATRCGAPEAAWVQAANGRLSITLRAGNFELAAIDELRVQGEHNAEDALAAATVALDLGATPEQVAVGLRSFEPLAHRIEPLATVAGVSYVNDSKATNPEASVKALTAFPAGSVVLMLGGRDKNTSLDELVAAARNTCHAVICYGEAGPRFAAAFREAGRYCSGEDAAPPAAAPPAASSDLALFLESGFDAAFAAASAAARPGSVVLLSPACSSYDEFVDYEQRGAHFRELVFALAQKQEVRDGS
ncbi:MAG: UDP-N-acetylmuramoyl-L-alanine--D-glutamate ligase [Coriobacteriales bacterium]|jgi:UDP-N-acetylmuramoylalanine--D-glutamate ligase|nr:UDP-N-acetylmuramoyl-L-alanine--D-glutamate ligase [Coriobacteriales bacterium]